MSSVTNRIAEIKQPRGGYIKPSMFDVRNLDDGVVLASEENVHGSIVGMAVDYLTRFMMGTPVYEAFGISLTGAQIAEKFGMSGAFHAAGAFAAMIQGLDDDSIRYACKLVTFDVWLRHTSNAMFAKTAAETEPDTDTIRNIAIMVRRSIAFWNLYGPITKDGFTFEQNGYTDTVDTGDGDFLTVDTLWDFKVLKTKPTSKHTLQILMYWIMGKHSGNDVFKNIMKIGMFNPRLNMVHMLDMTKVDPEIIKIVERDVICY